MLPIHPLALAGGEATASSCRVDKAWTVGSGAFKESDKRPDWLLTVGRGGGCYVRWAGALVGGTSPWLGQLRVVEVAAGKLPVRTGCAWVDVALQGVHLSEDALSESVAIEPCVQFE